MSHKALSRRASTPTPTPTRTPTSTPTKLRRSLAAGTLTVALLAPAGCVSDYDPHYMADDQPSHEVSYRLNKAGQTIVGVGLFVAYMAFWAWAESLNGCGCGR